MRPLPRATPLLILVVVALAASIVACKDDASAGGSDGGLEGGTNAADGGTAGDASADVSTDARCVLEGDRCVGAPSCCTIRGARIDTARQCIDGPPVTALGCVPSPPPEGSACGWASGLGCYVRTVDGGRESYVSDTGIPIAWIPGGEECPEPLRSRVEGLELRPCK